MREIVCVLAAAALFGSSIAVLPTAVAAPTESAGPVVTPRDLPAGFDLFETDPQQTHFIFGGATSIPAGFFGPGSQPWDGSVKFCGQPLVTFGGHDVGDADTVIQRLGGLTLPGPGSSATVPIELVSLSLVSCEPITIQVGNTTEQWDVKMGLSPRGKSQGSMTVRQTSANGGTFDSQLSVQPILTFVSPKGTTQTLDLGGNQTLSTGLRTQVTNDVWRRRCALPALAVPGLNEVFCPGLTPKKKKKLGIWQSPIFSIGWVPAQPRLEHFACYRVKEQGQRFASRHVQVTDQFGSHQPRLVKPRDLCNPAQKNSEPFLQKKVHLKCYTVQDKGFAPRTVVTRDQFGSLRLAVHKRRDLCMPSLKKLLKGGSKPTISGQPGSRLVDRFMCYDVTQQGNRSPIPVGIKDQFGQLNMTVQEAVILCNPAKVNNVASYHPIAHLVCYRVVANAGQPAFRPRIVQTSNQFGKEVLKVLEPETLCVPANKVLVN